MSENDSIAPQAQGKAPIGKMEPDPDTAREVFPVVFFGKEKVAYGEPTTEDEEAGLYDFRMKPEAVTAESEVEDDAPKDSSAPESVESSQSQVPTENVSLVSQEPIASVEKDSGPPKAEEPGTPTSSDPQTPGKSEQPASTPTQKSSSPTKQTSP
jgi:hypothetical protein